MARKQNDSSSKSQAIRDYLSEHPDAGPKEILTSLKQNGIGVSSALIVAVKRKVRNAGNTDGQKVRSPAATPPSHTASMASLSAADLLQAKKLVNSLGGLENAKRALQLLEQLS